MMVDLQRNRLAYDDLFDLRPLMPLPETERPSMWADLRRLYDGPWSASLVEFSAEVSAVPAQHRLDVVKNVRLLTTQQILPRALRVGARLAHAPAHATALESAADRCEQSTAWTDTDNVRRACIIAQDAHLEGVSMAAYWLGTRARAWEPWPIKLWFESGGCVRSAALTAWIVGKGEADEVLGLTCQIWRKSISQSVPS